MLKVSGSLHTYELAHVIYQKVNVIPDYVFKYTRVHWLIIGIIKINMNIFYARKGLHII